jgi:glutamate-1-semialdehyde 2,1-aminomutase
MPGGDTRTAIYYTPYPTYMEKGEGCRIYDCDGNVYTDYHNNYTSLIHGHAFQPVVHAAWEQLQKGTVFGAPGQVMYEHAQLLRSRVPSMERIRYTNSGTEATLMAMRAARAFTRKDVFVKMDGGYHGCHDFVEVNVWSDPDEKGVPIPRLTAAGVPVDVVRNTLVAHYNDLEGLEAILKANKDRIAGIILEPMQGAAGDLPAQPGYLRGVRELATRYGVLLVFDEIVTFRFSLGGIQAIEGIKPDLTTLGKIIGGGFAVGAYGGREEIMDLFNPEKPGSVSTSGTFNANNITMAAGIANLKAYDQAAIDRINALGTRLRQGFNRAFRAADLRGQATGQASMFTIHWTDASLARASDSAQHLIPAAELVKLLHLEMLSRGCFAPRRGQYAISTPMTDRHIDQTLEELAAALEYLRPYIVERTPHLLGS